MSIFVNDVTTKEQLCVNFSYFLLDMANNDERHIDMFKFETLSSMFKCDYCSELLKQPVSLPCGKTVCEYHLNIRNKPTIK